MKIKKGFIVRKVGDENIVVPVGEMSKEFHGMIKLNDSGCFLWNFFTQDHTAKEAGEALVQEYEIDLETAVRDAESFVKVLTENKLCE